MKRNALFAAFLLTACGSAAAENPNAVLTPDSGLEDRIMTGTVVDAASRMRLPGVSIEIEQMGTVTTTDEDGRFVVELPIADRVEVRASLAGYVPEVFTVELPLRGGVKAGLALDAGPVEMTGGM